MLLIIAHHYVVNSGLPGPMYADPQSESSLFLWLFGAWGKTAVNCFALITGYFMCRSSVSIQKFLKLLLVILIYKFIFFWGFAAGGYIAMTPKSVFWYMLPL